MAKSKKRKPAHDPGGNDESSGGVMMSLRGGFKSVAGAGPARKRTPAQRALDVLFWAAIAALLVLLMYRRFR